MPCPDDTQISELAARTLPATEAARLEAHIADCDICRNLVFALASSGAEPGSEAQAAERIGRFEVLDVVGRGAMGVVYRARDPELDRVVAIKVRRTRAKLDVAGEDRLRREAQALAKLAHPNVVTVYETGRHEGTAFVAMEYVDGVTLDAWLATQRSRDEVLAVLRDAGRGLAAAHDAGLVHRDFKPHNVFVSTDGVAKVGDFGLVRVEPSADEGTPGELAITLSVTGSIVGTPAYMAPEQLRGAPATEASDQFSFCVTLYEALYGKRPFGGTSVAELLAAMTPIDPPALPGVPRVVRQALRRGLAIEPAERFPSMSALLEAVSRRPIAKRWIAVASLGAIVLIAAGAFAATKSSSDPCAAPDPGGQRVFAADRTQAFRKAFAATNAHDAEGIAGRVAGLFADYGKRWQAASLATCRATTGGRQSAQLGDRQRACLERRLQQAEQLGAVLAATTDPAAVPKAAGAVLGLADVESCTRTDEAMLAGREPPPADKVAEVRRVEAQLDRIAGLHKTGQVVAAGKEVDATVSAARALGHPPLLAYGLMVQAAVYSETNRFDALEAILDEAAREAAKARDDRLAAEAWTRRVYAVGVHFARYDDAHQWASAAEAAVLRAGNPPDLRAQLHMNVGTLLIERAKLDEAQRELEAALELRTRFTPHATTAIADVHNNLAALLQRRGKMDEAQQQIEKAQSLYRSVHGEQHPEVIKTYINLGFMFAEREQPAKALEVLEKARAAGEVALGPDHLYVGIATDTMGLAQISLGHYEEAQKLHRRAHEIMLAKVGPKHPRTGYALANLGRASLRLGDYPAAIAAFRAAREVLREALGAKHDLVGRMGTSLGVALRFSGDVAAAMQEFEASLAILDGNTGQGGEDASMARVNLAELSLQAGKVAEARAQFQRAAEALAKTSCTACALTAHAGVVYCDAVQRRVTKAQLDELERLFAAHDISKLEPHHYAFLEYTRARAYAALGDKPQAREHAVASGEAYAKAKLPGPERQVTDWAAKELR